MAKAPKHVLVKLQELRKMASLETASFGFSTDKVVAPVTFYHGRLIQGEEYTLDHFLKESTKLHRETWILPLIDELIEWAKE